MEAQTPSGVPAPKDSAGSGGSIHGSAAGEYDSDTLVVLDYLFGDGAAADTGPKPERSKDAPDE